MKHSVFIILVFIIVYSCKNGNTKEIQNKSFRYYHTGRFLIKESYDSSGRIITKQYYNNDTIPYGAEFDYYPNGKIEKWKWFRHSNKFPDCIIYYDTNGIFDTLVGIPFIASAYDIDNELCIALINPPNIKFRLGYKDLYKDEIVKKVTFSPLLTDSISLVNINAYHKFQKEHKYMLYFLVVDSTHILGKSTTELINNADEKSNRVSNTDSFIAVDPPNISR